MPILVSAFLLTALVARPEHALSPDQAAALAAVRQYALDYTAQLPDYTCIQITKRWTQRTAAAQPARRDVIEEQVTFSSHKESYQVLTFNGEKAIGVDHDQITGAVISGEFGRMLYGIFNPQAGTAFQFGGVDKKHGQARMVFAYQVPQPTGMRLSFGPAGPSERAITAAFEGEVHADAGNKRVLRITAKSVGVASDFPVREVRVALEYKPVMVAGQEYTLPFHSEVHWRDIQTTVKSEIDYTQYRKFVSDATLKFDGDNDGKK